LNDLRMSVGPATRKIHEDPTAAEGQHDSSNVTKRRTSSSAKPRGTSMQRVLPVKVRDRPFS